MFPWAKFRTTKGAIKLHVGLDHEGYLPTFMQITDGKVHEVNMARTLGLPSGSLVVLDRSYTDYTWYNHLFENKVYLVVSTVASWCCVSIRTARRVMRKLVERRLLPAEQRYRRDGSCSSNRYRLQLEGRRAGCKETQWPGRAPVANWWLPRDIYN